MEGMIYNANHVLDQALSPETEGIPRGMFESCKGIILQSVVEAGFLFSGSVGTGVVIARKPDGSWSPPAALALGGVGCGVLIGAERKDVIIFAMDDPTFDAISGDFQYKIGGQASAAAGPVGREEEITLANVSGDKVGATYSYSFNKGVFAGMSIESAILGVRTKENHSFYGKEVATTEILTGAVEYPKGKGIEELHRKLDMLKEGKVFLPTPDDLERKDSMKAEAEKAGIEAWIQP